MVIPHPLIWPCVLICIIKCFPFKEFGASQSEQDGKNERVQGWDPSGLDWLGQSPSTTAEGASDLSEFTASGKCCGLHLPGWPRVCLCAVHPGQSQAEKTRQAQTGWQALPALGFRNGWWTSCSVEPLTRPSSGLRQTPCQHCFYLKSSLPGAQDSQASLSYSLEWKTTAQQATYPHSSLPCSTKQGDCSWPHTPFPGKAPRPIVGRHVSRGWHEAGEVTASVLHKTNLAYLKYDFCTFHSIWQIIGFSKKNHI